jgi:aldose 1-epimerase
MSTTFEEDAGLTLSSGAIGATFLPGLGMLGTSLRHDGHELLALPGGLDGYRAGRVTGLPLLAPWANRLGARRYEVEGLVVDLHGLDLPTDEHGLPLHGTMTAQRGWEVAHVGERSLTARFDVGARPDLLASFPFPHELVMQVDVDGDGLTVATTLVPTGDRAVPVAFGYHPYLRLGTGRRAAARLRLPARRHVELDERGLPTGASHAEAAEDAPLGTRAFDDLYTLSDDRRLAVTDDDRAVSVVLGEGYGHAQVYTPADAEFVCLEPMTAPVNALVTGGYPVASPGQPFTARFTVRAARP